MNKVKKDFYDVDGSMVMTFPLESWNKAGITKLIFDKLVDPLRVDPPGNYSKEYFLS